jgi:hypothetical protein
VACVALFHGIFALKFAVYPLFIRTSFWSSRMFYFHDQGIKILGLIQVAVSIFVILATTLVVLVNLST